MERRDRRGGERYDRDAPTRRDGRDERPRGLRRAAAHVEVPRRRVRAAAGAAARGARAGPRAAPLWGPPRQGQERISRAKQLCESF